MIFYLLPDFPFSQRKLLHNLTIETKFGKQNQESVHVYTRTRMFQKNKNSAMPSLER